jgi:hypothetical protein
MRASSSKACSMEFIIAINEDSNGIGPSSSKAGGVHAYHLDEYAWYDFVIGTINTTLCYSLQLHITRYYSLLLSHMSYYSLQFSIILFNFNGIGAFN